MASIMSFSTAFSSINLTVWPISSTTKVAVSRSIVWLIVAIAPILNMILITSAPFTAIFSARSATVILSGNATSWIILAVGFWKPCSCLDGFLFLRPNLPRRVNSSSSFTLTREVRLLSGFTRPRGLSLSLSLSCLTGPFLPLGATVDFLLSIAG